MVRAQGDRHRCLVEGESPVEHLGLDFKVTHLIDPIVPQQTLPADYAGRGICKRADTSPGQCSSWRSAGCLGQASGGSSSIGVNPPAMMSAGVLRDCSTTHWYCCLEASEKCIIEEFVRLKSATRLGDANANMNDSNWIGFSQVEGMFFIVR
jgi:hypothetical protein